MADRAAAWIRFLRLYGPGPSNDNQYDEKIRHSAKRNGFAALEFEHPLEAKLTALFAAGTVPSSSVILTGTAGDGKSHLCGRVWSKLGGDPDEWDSDEPYLIRHFDVDGKRITFHLIRDLTGLPEHDGTGRYASKEELLIRLSESLFSGASTDVFLLAANDGQLVESWRRLPSAPSTTAAHALFEDLLVENKEERSGIPLQFFNLSRVPSSTLFDLAITAVVEHDGWHECQADGHFFSEKCPIRQNLSLLRSDLVRERLRALFELCDHNDVHIPIRRLLQVLVNAVLGHPDVKDGLMRATDVAAIVEKGTVGKASFFNNVFGGNLSETRRDALEVFRSLERFGIGHETSNKIDNLLIFGDNDDNLRETHDLLLAADQFYGADEEYRSARRAYVEGGDESTADGLLDLMVRQRRALFFKIPKGLESDLGLWHLTVYHHAGEYLDCVVHALARGERVDRAIVARVVRGLNRVFLGMLVNTDRELLLATSITFSNAPVSQVLEDRISVQKRNQESIEVALEDGRPALVVNLSGAIRRSLPLSLTRFEFLSRVADGALPASFSRECHDDILAFKSTLLAAVAERRGGDEGAPRTFAVTLLKLDAVGNPTHEAVEFRDA